MTGLPALDWTRFALLLLLGLGLVACPAGDDDDTTDGTTDDDDATQASLEPAFEAALLEALDQELAAQGVSGLAIGVRPHDSGAWSAAAGFAGPDSGVALRRGDRFKIGSVTETFVMATLLQLNDEVKLFRIDRPPDVYDPDMPESWGTTVRQMLDHTSGGPDYRSHGDFDPTAIYTPAELLALAMQLGVLHGPGQARTYSQTNYVIAGQVVEGVTGDAWPVEVGRRFLGPLGLSGTTAPSGATGWGDVTPGYVSDADATLWNHPSAFDAAGNMTMTAGDLATWGSALFGGEVLDDQQVYEVVGTPFHADDRGFGLGVELIDEDSPIEQWVNRGAIEGYGAWMGYRQDLDTSIAVLGNGWPGGNGEWTADVAGALWSVIEDHVEPPTGDDDDAFDVLPEPYGQPRLWGLQRFDPGGAAAAPEHDGVMIGGAWDFDNDGQTVGHFTLTSADFSGGEPAGAVECSFDAHGNYSPEDLAYNITGVLQIDEWGPLDCPQWPGVDSWYGRVQGNVEGLHLVPLDYIAPDWAPTWSGWQDDLGGAATVQEYMQNWLASTGANRGAVETPYLVLAQIAGLTEPEPQVQPWTYLGFLWKRPGD